MNIFSFTFHFFSSLELILEKCRILTHRQEKEYIDLNDAIRSWQNMQLKDYYILKLANYQFELFQGIMY